MKPNNTLAPARRRPRPCTQRRQMATQPHLQAQASAAPGSPCRRHAGRAGDVTRSARALQSALPRPARSAAGAGAGAAQCAGRCSTCRSSGLARSSSPGSQVNSSGSGRPARPAPAFEPAAAGRHAGQRHRSGAQGGRRTAGQHSRGVAQVVEEWVRHRLQRGDAPYRRVLQQLRHLLAGHSTSSSRPRLPMRTGRWRRAWRAPGPPRREGCALRRSGSRSAP